MHELTGNELIGTRWLNPFSRRAPITVAGIDPEGRLLCMGAYETMTFRSAADLKRFGYVMITQAPLVVPPLPALGTVERYIQTGEIHAPPVAAKCEPTCTPAAPCFAVKVCPAWAEEGCEQSDWAVMQDQFSSGWMETDIPAAGEPHQPELRCAREWGCGLARTR